MTETGKKRIQSTISKTEFRELETWAREEGISITKVIQNLIHEKKFFKRKLDEGGKILIEDKNGNIREIMWK